MNILVVPVGAVAAQGEFPGRRRLVDMVVVVTLSVGRIIRADR